LPPDEQIFLIRERERRKRAEERELVKTQRVWEKTTSASRLGTKLSLRSLHYDSQNGQESEEATAKATLRRVASEGGLAHTQPRRNKENVAQFVAKKREMFLVQMSLDVKKAEIQKLEDLAKKRSDALTESEQRLHQDNDKFKEFVKKNDQKAHQVMRAAEDTTRVKQERSQQIKSIRTQLSTVQSEIARSRELMEEYLKYKSFLMKLTPQEWKDARAADKKERKRLRKEAWVDERVHLAEAKMEKELAAAEQEMAEKAAEQIARSRRRPKRELEEASKEREKELEARKRRIKKKYPPREAYANEYEEVSSGEEMPMYFQEPAQLLDIFTSLEGSNLFLIQNSQEKEQTVEDIQRRLEETRRVSTSKMQRMKQGLTSLERHIEEEKQQIAELKERLNPGGHDAQEQDQYQQELLQKIMEVHEACGHESEHDPEALQMLTTVEAVLEDYLRELADYEKQGLGPLVEKLEHAADVRRREKAKRARKEAQEKKSEERLKASLLRSQAPIHKKSGKQLMFRSAPLLHMRRVIVEDDGYEKAKRDHGIFGMYLGKDGSAFIDEPIKQEE